MKNATLNGDWEGYSDYNKILRAWFVAFGVGVPATFLINQRLEKYLFAPDGDSSIFIVFLAGAAAQVLMAFINKIINWCAYYKTIKFAHKEPSNRWEKTAAFIAQASNWFLIDVLADIITISCFSYAIARLIYLVYKHPLN